MSLEYLFLIQNKMSIITTKIEIPQILVTILTKLQEHGYRPYLVGGCVRDSFLNKQIKDFDVEIFDLPFLEDITFILEQFGSVNSVGKSFGVLKLSTKELEFDFSLPRTEQKTGKTHRDFLVKTDSKLSYKDAARRRDFTINAIYYDYFSKTFIDPFNGINDLDNKIIKHIDDKTFVEDSLRVYRAIGFASRFNFKIDSQTKDLCSKIIESKELSFLPKERVFEELKKIFLKSENPSIGLKLIDDFNLFSINFKQAYDYIDNLAMFLENKNFSEFRKLYIFFAFILKGKKQNEILNFLESITSDKRLTKNILLLCDNTLSLDAINLKRLSLLIILEDLVLIEKAYKKKDILKIEYLAKELNIYDKSLEILVNGKDLINLGLKQSSIFKDILDYALSIQIENNLNRDLIIEKIIKKYKIKTI